MSICGFYFVHTGATVFKLVVHLLDSDVHKISRQDTKDLLDFSSWFEEFYLVPKRLTKIVRRKTRKTSFVKSRTLASFNWSSRIAAEADRGTVDDLLKTGF